MDSETHSVVSSLLVSSAPEYPSESSSQASSEATDRCGETIGMIVDELAEVLGGRCARAEGAAEVGAGVEVEVQRQPEPEPEPEVDLMHAGAGADKDKDKDTITPHLCPGSLAEAEGPREHEHEHEHELEFMLMPMPIPRCMRTPTPTPTPTSTPPPMSVSMSMSVSVPVPVPVLDPLPLSVPVSVSMSVSVSAPAHVPEPVSVSVCVPLTVSVSVSVSSTTGAEEVGRQVGRQQQDRRHVRVMARPGRQLSPFETTSIADAFYSLGFALSEADAHTCSTAELKRLINGKLSALERSDKSSAAGVLKLLSYVPPYHRGEYKQARRLLQHICKNTRSSVATVCLARALLSKTLRTEAFQTRDRRLLEEAEQHVTQMVQDVELYGFDGLVHALMLRELALIAGARCILFQEEEGIKEALERGCRSVVLFEQYGWVEIGRTLQANLVRLLGHLIASSERDTRQDDYNYYQSLLNFLSQGGEPEWTLLPFHLQVRYRLEICRLYIVCPQLCGQCGDGAGYREFLRNASVHDVPSHMRSDIREVCGSQL